jgi:hypothetical protein
VVQLYRAPLPSATLPPWFEPTVYAALAVAAVVALGFLSMSVRQRLEATPGTVFEA